MDFADVYKRLLEVEFAARDGKLPSCDQNDFFCQYGYLCDWEAQRNVEIKVLGVTEAQSMEVYEWGRKYLDASEKEKQIEKVKEEARTRLLELIGVPQTGSRRVTVFDLSVVASIAVRESLSLAAARAKFGDQVNELVSRSEYPRLNVSLLKEK